jgi:hypothetical protein
MVAGDGSAECSLSESFREFAFHEGERRPGAGADV